MKFRLINHFCHIYIFIFVITATQVGLGQNQKFDPLISQFLSESDSLKTMKVWIFFKDKDSSIETKQNQSSATLEKIITNRSINRRRKMRAGDELIDNADLNVNPLYIEKVLETGVQKRVVTRWFNGISVEANAAQLRTIGKMPFVENIQIVHSYLRKRMDQETTKPDHEKIDEYIPSYKINNDYSADNNLTNPIGLPGNTYQFDYGPSLAQLEQINVPVLHEQGFDGSGVLIGILDSGFRKSHQAFRHLKIVDERDFVMGDDDTQQDLSDPEDCSDFHGTCTLSILAGYLEGILIGPAYNSEFLLAKTEKACEEVEIEEDYWVAGVEWADSLGADIISSSLGYPLFYEYEQMDGNTSICTRAADRAASLGIIVFNAQGNELPDWNYVHPPADGDSVLAVGAVNSNGDLASFSCPGPTYDGRIKPDVCAMGVDVVCADNYSDLAVIQSNGTSFSTPLVAGAAALLMQIHPDWVALDVIEALKSTASQHNHPDNGKGWGIVDALKASGIEIPILSVQEVTVDDSQGNGNGFIDPGEIVGPGLFLKNTGSCTASGVEALLRTTSPEVSLIDSVHFIGDMQPDSINASSQIFWFRVMDGTQDGTMIHLKICLSDTEARTWETNINFTVFVSAWQVTWKIEKDIARAKFHLSYSVSSDPRMAVCVDDSGYGHIIWCHSGTATNPDTVGYDDAQTVPYIFENMNGWHDPEELFGSTLQPRETFPHIFTFRENVFALCFYNVQEPDAYMCVRNENGWSNPVRILEEDNRILSSPSAGVAMDSTGALHVISSDTEGLHWLSHSLFSNSSWTHHPISQERGMYPDLVIDHLGKLHLTFIRPGTTGNFSVFYTCSADNGESWSIPVEAASGSIDYYFPKMAVTSDGMMHILYLEGASYTYNGCRGLYHICSGDGSLWSIPEIVSYPQDCAVSLNYNCCADRDGDLHLVWAEGIGVRGDGQDWKEIYYAQWSSGAWSPRQSMTSEINTHKMKLSPYLYLDLSGRLHMVFVQLPNNLHSSQLDFIIRHMTSSQVCEPAPFPVPGPDDIPEFYTLCQNFPNPFNNYTTIRFHIPEQSKASVKVYNLLGQEVATLVDELLSPNVYEIKWDGKDLQSGLYIVRLRAGRFIKTRKVVLQR